MRLERVLAGDLCAGCGLCASILGPERAQMKLAEPGYLRPSLSEAPHADESALIDQVCPGGRLDFEADPKTEQGGVWGPIVELATGYAIDDELRFKASSGGALSAIAKSILDSGQADYILHIGPSSDVPWLNEVKHSTTRENVVANTGSRYAPSAPLAEILRRLDEKSRFIFIGKPCDVAALRMYARHDRRVDERITAMLSFMCAGVPSEHGTRILLERMNVRPEDVSAFRFRGFGWPGHATATLKDGSERSLSYAESWGEVLNAHVQKRCKICPDGIGVFADVVCGDAWYDDGLGHPSFAERDGRSIVIARTSKGASIVGRAFRSGAINLQPLELSELGKMQPYQEQRIRLTLSRVIALALLGRPAPSYRGLRLLRAGLRAGLRSNLRSFAGALLRILRGRL